MQNAIAAYKVCIRCVCSVALWTVREVVYPAYTFRGSSGHLTSMLFPTKAHSKQPKSISSE